MEEAFAEPASRADPQPRFTHKRDVAEQRRRTVPPSSDRTCGMRCLSDGLQPTIACNLETMASDLV